MHDSHCREKVMYNLDKNRPMNNATLPNIMWTVVEETTPDTLSLSTISSDQITNIAKLLTSNTNSSIQPAMIFDPSTSSGTVQIT